MSCLLPWPEIVPIVLTDHLNPTAPILGFYQGIDYEVGDLTQTLSCLLIPNWLLSNSKRKSWVGRMVDGSHRDMGNMGRGGL